MLPARSRSSSGFFGVYSEQPTALNDAGKIVGSSTLNSGSGTRGYVKAASSAFTDLGGLIVGRAVDGDGRAGPGGSSE